MADRMIPERATRRKKRLPRYAGRPRGHDFPPDQFIYERPEHVKIRTRFEDWEGNLIIFERAGGKMKVASLQERKIRFAVLFCNNDRSFTQFMRKLMEAMEPMPSEAHRTITFDRGFEFRDWRNLKTGFGTEVWFCGPQAPRHKVSVEKLNKSARRYLPRVTSVAALSNRSMNAICDRLNKIRSKCLGSQSPM